MSFIQGLTAIRDEIIGKAREDCYDAIGKYLDSLVGKKVRIRRGTIFEIIFVVKEAWPKRTDNLRFPINIVGTNGEEIFIDESTEVTEIKETTTMS